MIKGYYEIKNGMERFVPFQIMRFSNAFEKYKVLEEHVPFLRYQAEGSWFWLKQILIKFLGVKILWLGHLILKLPSISYITLKGGLAQIVTIGSSKVEKLLSS